MDTARRLVTLPRPPQGSLEERIKDQIAEYNKLHAAGLTAVRHPGDSIENYRMRQEMQRRGVLTMRVTQLMRPGSQSGGHRADHQELESRARRRRRDAPGRRHQDGGGRRVRGRLHA